MAPAWTKPSRGLRGEATMPRNAVSVVSALFGRLHQGQRQARMAHLRRAIPPPTFPFRFTCVRIGPQQA